LKDIGNEALKIGGATVEHDIVRGREGRPVILDRDPGDITTIEDEGSVDEARQAWQQLRAETKQA